MNVKVLNEGEDIFPLLVKELVAKDTNDKDFSKKLVVFTGRRPAFFLIDALKKGLKSPFIPPVILSIDEFIDYCYEQELRKNDTKIDTLSACKIIKDLLDDKSDSKKQPVELNRFLPLGFKLFSSFEELLLADVNKELLRLKDYLIDAKNTMENLIRLSDVYDTFYQCLSRKGMSTRAVRYREVSKGKIQLNDFEKIIFAGFFAVTKCEERIFKKFENDRRVSFVFQGEYAKDYFLKKESNAKAVMPVENIELFECPDSHSQVFKLSEILLNELKDKKGKENFLIIVPSSDTLIPLLNALPLSHDEYNISLGYPLIRTPLYSFITHLFDVVKSIIDGKFYVPDYLKFILHPYTKNILIKNNAEVSRIIFHTIERKLLENQFKVYVSREELEDKRILDEVLKEIEGILTFEELKSFLREIHLNTVEKLINLANVRDFAKKMKDIVNFVYEKTTAKKHIMFFPYCETMLLALTELEYSLFAEEHFDTVVHYFEFFKRFLTLYNVRFHGTPLKDIQILGFLEARNLKFDNVFILDLNEGVIPSSEKDDEILPFDVRKWLGVPTYEEKDRLFEFYLRNILAGSKKAWLFYIEDENKEKSRFLEKIIWEKQKKERNLDKRFYTPVSYKFNLSSYKPNAVSISKEIKEFLKKLTYTATMVDTYYTCPLKFYYQFVLLPKETEQISEDLEKHHVGTIIHNLLKSYYECGNTGYDKTKFRELLEHTFEKVFGSEQKGKTLILKKQIEEKISDFIENYKKIVNCDKFEILALEKKCQSKLILNNQEITIEGKVDRVEKRDDKVFIVDFKISNNEYKYKVNWRKFDDQQREKWKKAFKSLQLVFYMVLLNNSYKPHNASYFLLEKKKHNEMEIRLFNDNKESSSKTLKDIVLKILEEITEGNTFTPTSDLSDCKYCVYKQICWRN